MSGGVVRCSARTYAKKMRGGRVFVDYPKQCERMVRVDDDTKPWRVRCWQHAARLDIVMTSA